MPFDQFKTQVLLLHSEQNTLDTLSSGFSDRYTVHCAKSGSEALNTLGDTPIHVIVSAQHLPGMSGAEALREAKKRSPDTIGILLTGEKEGAVVGEKELFQVVRGGISTDDLIRLIDSATQQTRLMALAESANDIAANIDDTVAEHIIMETSENGATIISDGTGRMPALDPTTVPKSGPVGAAMVDILVITKDKEFLSTIKDSTRGMHNVRCASSLKQAEDTIRKYKIGVALVDAATVASQVERLTEHLRKLQKRLVSIVAGRRGDGEMLMDLINRGKVYRFLLKPVSPGRARLAIEASVKHHLEAPDSAFKLSRIVPPPAKPVLLKPALKSRLASIKTVPLDTASSKPEPTPESTPKPAAKPNPKPAAKTTPTPVAESTPKPVSKATPRPVSKTTRRPAPEIKARRNEALIHAGDKLSDAFDDGASFARPAVEKLRSLAQSIIDRKSSRPGTGSIPATKAAAPGNGAPTSRLNLKLIAVGAAAVIVVVGVGFWLFGSSDEREMPDEAVSVTPTTMEGLPDVGREAAVVDEPAVNIDELLEEARLARDAGQVFNPPESNAIELFLAALVISPDDSIAVAELDATLDEALGMAETALIENRTADTAAALARVALARPDHERLPFLNAQLEQLLLRDHLVSARDAIRDDRLEDAATAIAAARELEVEETGEIKLVEEELFEARSARRTDEVLALANARLESGSLTSPVNDNARYYFQLALSKDPENAAAQTGLSVVASKIVLQAREEIDGGRFNSAEALLAEARQLDPTSDELGTTSKALADARQRVEDERLRVEAEQRAAAKREADEKRLAEEREAAERIAEEQRLRNEQLAAEAAAALAAAEAAREAAAAQAAASQPATLVEQNGTAAEVPETASVVDSPTESAPNEAPIVAAATLESPAEEEEPVEASAPGESPVAASTLTRTRYVAPRYPRSAERRNLSGWVDVVFTVALDGSVKNIEVVNSQPGDTFVNSATKAVAKWEFEPVVENGDVVEKRAGVRMMFALQ